MFVTLREAFGFALILFVVQTASLAQSLTDAAAGLARKIAQSGGAGETFVLNVRNVSSLNPPEVAQAERALETELLTHRLKIDRGPDAASRIDVTLSENIDGLLWVAEIRNGERRDVVRVAAPRPLPAAGASEPAPM